MTNSKQTELQKSGSLKAYGRRPLFRVNGRDVSVKTTAISGTIVILALLLLTGYGSIIIAALPILILVACPLMHIFMHGGGKHKH